jgi:hypothetical protein
MNKCVKHLISYGMVTPLAEKLDEALLNPSIQKNIEGLLAECVRSIADARGGYFHGDRSLTQISPVTPVQQVVEGMTFHTDKAKDPTSAKEFFDKAKYMIDLVQVSIVAASNQVYSEKRALCDKSLIVNMEVWAQTDDQDNDILPENGTDDVRTGMLQRIRERKEIDPLTSRLTSSLALCCDSPEGSAELGAALSWNSLQHEAVETFLTFLEEHRDVEPTMKLNIDKAKLSVKQSRLAQVLLHKILSFKKNHGVAKSTRKKVSDRVKRATSQIGTLSEFPLQMGLEKLVLAFTTNNVQIAKDWEDVLTRRDVEATRNMIKGVQWKDLSDNARLLGDVLVELLDVMDSFASAGYIYNKEIKEAAVGVDKSREYCLNFVASMYSANLLVNKLMHATNGKSRSAFGREYDSMMKGFGASPIKVMLDWSKAWNTDIVASEKADKATSSSNKRARLDAAVSSTETKGRLAAIAATGGKKRGRVPKVVADADAVAAPSGGASGGALQRPKRLRIKTPQRNVVGA